MKVPFKAWKILLDSSNQNGYLSNDVVRSVAAKTETFHLLGEENPENLYPADFTTELSRVPAVARPGLCVSPSRDGVLD